MAERGYLSRNAKRTIKASGYSCVKMTNMNTEELDIKDVFTSIIILGAGYLLCLVSLIMEHLLYKNLSAIYWCCRNWSNL